MAQNKKFDLYTLLMAIVAAVFMVVLGACFSIITGFKAADNVLLVQLVIWSADIISSYSLSWWIFKMLKKEIPYFNWIAWGYSIAICTALIVLIVGTIEVAFVSMLTIVVPWVGHVLALTKKNCYKENVSIDNESVQTDHANSDVSKGEK